MDFVSDILITILAIFIPLSPIIFFFTLNIYYFTHNKRVISNKTREKRIKEYLVKVEGWEELGYDGTELKPVANWEDVKNRLPKTYSYGDRWVLESYIDDEKFKKRNTVEYLICNIGIIIYGIIMYVGLFT